MSESIGNRTVKPDNAPPYQKQRVRRGLRADRIRPGDIEKYQPATFCDDCGHFDQKRGSCTMGYAAVHTRSAQMAQYELAGTMAFCRFCEID